MKAAILALAVVLALSGVQSIPAAAVEAPAIKSGPTYVVEHGTEYILHAGGITPAGTVGSNSLEALDYSYQRGYRAMEMDFFWTTDGQLVCVHDWEAYYAHSLGKEALTLQEFESVNGSYGFTSMTIDTLAQWMTQHDDVIIVTDIKENCVEGAKMIAEQYPQLRDRFYIQIYNTQDYEAVSALGFQNIILTVYQMTWAEKADTNALVAFANSHTLAGITFPIDLVDLIPGYLETLVASGTPVFVHTVNDAETQRMLFDAGVAGVYTDGTVQ